MKPERVALLFAVEPLLELSARCISAAQSKGESDRSADGCENDRDRVARERHACLRCDGEVFFLYAERNPVCAGCGAVLVIDQSSRSS